MRHQLKIALFIYISLALMPVTAGQKDRRQSCEDASPGISGIALELCSRMRLGEVPTANPAVFCKGYRRDAPRGNGGPLSERGIEPEEVARNCTEKVPYAGPCGAIDIWDTHGPPPGGWVNENGEACSLLFDSGCCQANFSSACVATIFLGLRELFMITDDTGQELIGLTTETDPDTGEQVPLIASWGIVPVNFPDLDCPDLYAIQGELLDSARAMCRGGDPVEFCSP